MKTIIIEQWENEHYPLGRIKKQKLAEKSEHEIILSLIAWLRCLQLLDLEKQVKFEIELDKMPTTQQQKGIKKVKGKLQFYDRRGTKTTALKLNS